MINARHIYSEPAQPYCFQYGPRGWRRSAANVNTLVDFSFLCARPGLDVNDLQELTPEWNKDMQYTIQNLNGED